LGTNDGAAWPSTWKATDQWTGHSIVRVNGKARKAPGAPLSSGLNSRRPGMRMYFSLPCQGSGTYLVRGRDQAALQDDSLVKGVQ
jgi:hypothetical protein